MPSENQENSLHCVLGPNSELDIKPEIVKWDQSPILEVNKLEHVGAGGGEKFFSCDNTLWYIEEMVDSRPGWASGEWDPKVGSKYSVRIFREEKGKFLHCVTIDDQEGQNFCFASSTKGDVAFGWNNGCSEKFGAISLIKSGDNKWVATKPVFVSRFFYQPRLIVGPQGKFYACVECRGHVDEQNTIIGVDSDKPEDLATPSYNPSDLGIFEIDFKEQKVNSYVIIRGLGGYKKPVVIDSSGVAHIIMPFLREKKKTSSTRIKRNENQVLLHHIAYDGVKRKTVRRESLNCFENLDTFSYIYLAQNNSQGCHVILAYGGWMPENNLSEVNDSLWHTKLDLNKSNDSCESQEITVSSGAETFHHEPYIQYLPGKGIVVIALEMVRGNSLKKNNSEIREKLLISYCPDKGNWNTKRIEVDGTLGFQARVKDGYIEVYTDMYEVIHEDWPLEKEGRDRSWVELRKIPLNRLFSSEDAAQHPEEREKKEKDKK